MLVESLQYTALTGRIVINGAPLHDAAVDDLWLDR